MAASRHDAGACQARMQAPRGPFPRCPSSLRAVRCVTVRTVRGGGTHVGRRSAHRRAALGGTCVRACGGVRGPGGGPGPLGLRARRGRPRGVLGRAGRPAGLGQALGHGHDLGPPLGEVVRGRPAQRVVQLPRPARRGRRRGQGRVLLGGRARRGAGDHLPGTPRRRLPVRERPQGPRRAQGRPSRDLPGHDPRAPGRDARVRSDRGAALGRLRWLLIGGPPRSHQRRRGQGLDHRRRWLSPRRRRAAEGQRGRGGPRVSDDRARRHGPADRRRARVHRGAGPLVPRPGRRTVDRVRARTLGRRAPALPALHERDHGETQGHRAYDGGLPHPGGRDASDDLRHPRGRRLLVRRGHRVGHGALVHRVRTARQPHHQHHLRGGAGHSRPGSMVGDRRALPGHDLVHGAHRYPFIHALGHAASRDARSVVASAARVRRRAHQS